jgi:hypothetical protein
MAEKGYAWLFNPSSDAVEGDPVDQDSHLVQLTDAGKVVYHLVRSAHKRY